MQLDSFPGCMGLHVKTEHVPPGVPQLDGTAPFVYGDELRRTLQVGPHNQPG